MVVLVVEVLVVLVVVHRPHPEDQCPRERDERTRRACLLCLPYNAEAELTSIVSFTKS